MANRVPQPEDDQLTVFTRRMFSSFSLQHNVYCVPVDQVRGNTANLAPSAGDTALQELTPYR